MTVRAKFTVAAGQFQNVKVEFEAADAHALLLELNQFTDSFKQQLGEFHAELESHITVAREEMFEGVRKNAVEVLQSLGATVVGEIPMPKDSELSDSDLSMAIANGPGDVAHAASVVRPWNKTQAAVAKVWDKPKVAALDGF